MSFKTDLPMTSAMIEFVIRSMTGAMPGAMIGPLIESLGVLHDPHHDDAFTAVPPCVMS